MVDMILRWIAEILSAIAGIIAVLSKTKSNGKITKIGLILIAIVFIGLVMIIYSEVNIFIENKIVEKEKVLDRLYLMILEYPLKDLVLDFYLDTSVLRKCPDVGIFFGFKSQAITPYSNYQKTIFYRGNFWYDCELGWSHSNEKREFSFELTPMDTLVRIIISDFALYDGPKLQIRNISKIRDLASISIQICAFKQNITYSSNKLKDQILSSEENPVSYVDIKARSTYGEQFIVRLRGIYIFHGGDFIFVPEEWANDSDFKDLIQKQVWRYNEFLLDLNLMRPYLEIK